eukprot:TRINITY_DN47393_c0_g1_i1.p1 TRINITY_DN47393_c0_g1~~TRINITY_DN47393_c0_g1_i1.p1  ORF type:complete len:563 (+),score=90.99 TRINITY_DN47393_c0_g1_i1:104-1792(+)
MLSALVSPSLPPATAIQAHSTSAAAALSSSRGTPLCASAKCREGGGAVASRCLIYGGVVAAFAARSGVRCRTARRRLQRRAGSMRDLAEGIPPMDAGSFMKWLEKNGAMLDKVKLEQKQDGSGAFSVFARRDMEEGEVICEVPRKLALKVPIVFPPESADGVLAEASPKEEPDVLNTPEERKALQTLAQRLCDERRQGGQSKWAPYINMLPDPVALHPLSEAWPDDFVRQSYLLQRFYRTVAERDEAVLEALDETVYKRRRWAVNAIWTRAQVLETSNGGTVLAIVPFIDMFNQWTLQEGTTGEPWACHFEEFGKLVGMVADRPIRCGEELLALYDQNSDAVLLGQYGIMPAVPGANAWNRAGVPLDPSVICCPVKTRDGTEEPAESGLVSARAAALTRHGWADLRSPLLFQLPDDARPEGGLLALARLLALPSSEAIDEWEHRIFSMDASGGDKLDEFDFERSWEQRAWELVGRWTHECRQTTFRNSEDMVERFEDPQDPLSDLAEAIAGVLVGEVEVLDEAERTAISRAAIAGRRRFGAGIARKLLRKGRARREPAELDG